MNEAKFPLGRVVITPSVRDSVDASEVQACLRRHHAGDWGILDASDRAQNDKAVTAAGSLHSAYQIKKTKIWIITEPDRSVTTVLLPGDY